MAFRAFHAVIAVEMLLAIAYVWWCALSGRRDRLLRMAAASLIGEGVLVAANHGDCPLGDCKNVSATLSAVRAGALSARRKAGCADAWRHHRCRACPTGGTRSTRRPLGGEVDEMALCGASGTTGALRGFVSRPPGQWGSEEFGGLLRWALPWSIGDGGILGRIPASGEYPIVGVWLGGGAALMFILAALAVMGWWVPFGWWRVLAMGGAILSLLLMVGFLESRNCCRWSLTSSFCGQQ